MAAAQETITSLKKYKNRTVIKMMGKRKVALQLRRIALIDYVKDVASTI